jgi:hypothetical protein
MHERVSSPSRSGMSTGSTWEPDSSRRNSNTCRTLVSTAVATLNTPRVPLAARRQATTSWTCT